ncbi:MAG: hypothetical protein QM728_02420 [Gordonia sp. (in: high G+C Gram-positive bacteria)]|uniref:hypothetical protein n=1 Tax=Gordonia sp. (in: high G+C Gram-positive bacteria) TaxID=84139 RepID=UPI0039E47E46
MSTPQPSNGAAGPSGLNLWKVAAIVGVGLVLLMILEPIIKGLIWIGILALAVYGGLVLFTGGKSGTKQ